MTSKQSAPEGGAPGLPWQGQPYSTKRHGVTITNCDTEPVQTPGCVQAHGVLLALRPGVLTIAQASENTLAVLGHAAADLLNQPVAAVLGEQGQSRLARFLAVEPVEQNPIYLCSVAAHDGRPLDVTVHTNGGVVLLELEATGRPSEPADAAASPDYYALVKKTVARMQSAEGLQSFCDLVAQEVRALTGMDRVMIYKFHADGHGEVFAESAREGIAPWLGLHYPAADIPSPAREVFKRIWLRPTPDVSGELAEMVPLVHPDNGAPLEMTHCILRGASVMYTDYLKNMKVTAGVTMPIRRGNDLWGLIAAHHYTGPKHLPYQVRAACEFIAQVASLQYQAADDRDNLLYRLELEGVQQKLITTAAQKGELTCLTEGDPNLVDAVDASGAALFHDQRWWCLGATPAEAQLTKLAEWVHKRPAFQSATRPIYATDHLAAEYPDAAAFAEVASGVLAVPLARSQNSLLMWFRPETISTVRWAGNPNDTPSVPGPHGLRLTPRASFELFAESVHQRAPPWRQVELDAVARLRLLLMELVVARAERLAGLNADLSRSNEELDAFAYVASHDLKEPLRGIHKFAHQLLEDADEVNQDQRHKLDGLMRLTVRMDSLLDSLLLFSRVGRAALERDACDLNQVVAEAVEMVGSRRDETQAEFVVPRPLPTVHSDWVRCREIYVNLLSNALKYNDKSHKRVEIGWIEAHEDHPRPRRAPQAAGQNIYYVKDNGIGIEAKHYEQVFKMFKRLHARDVFGGGSGAGLPIAKKLVERLGGQIWLDSTPGEGSIFYFSLPAGERDGE
jgi:chemotaxis family two-component system sensor kinase Cph1